MAKTQSRAKFVLCIANKDCEDLEKGKVCTLLSDARAKGDGYLRVIDESGEDYLYPESLFVPRQSARAAARIRAHLVK